RRVHLECLARLLRLLLLAEVLDGPHVVEPVRELDEDDANVLRHRDDHLPVVLGLRLLAALEGDPGQLRDTLDELRDLGAGLGANLLDIRVRILDHVVQERRSDRLLVQVELGADARDAERMMDELLSGPPRLPLVSALGELEGAAQELLVDVGVVRLDLGDELLDQVFAMPLGVEDTHIVSVLSAFLGSFAAGKERGVRRRTATVHAQLSPLVAPASCPAPRPRDARRTGPDSSRPRIGATPRAAGSPRGGVPGTTRT